MKSNKMCVLMTLHEPEVWSEWPVFVAAGEGQHVGSWPPFSDK